MARELWDRVQAVLDGRKAKRHRRAKHDFAFSRLIECGHCGSSIVGEIKKQRYVYYHCTGYRGKCGEPYVRQEVIEEKFSQMLGRLAFDDEVLAWVREALSQSHAEEKRDHEQAIARLRRNTTDCNRGYTRCMWTGWTGGLMASSSTECPPNGAPSRTGAFRTSNATRPPTGHTLEEGIRVLELAKNAQKLFDKQEPREKRQLLSFIISNCSWKGGELTVCLRQPVDLLPDTSARALDVEESEDAHLAKRSVWLLRLDSNRQPSG